MTPNRVRKVIVAAGVRGADSSDVPPSRLLQLLRERVSALLEQTGRTQTDLAAAIKVKPSAISQFLGGRRGIEVYRIDLIAKFFDLSVEDLLVPPQKPLAASAVLSTLPAAPGGSGAVTPPQDTGGAPGKADLVVPSPDHRALFAVLSTLSTAELQPIAEQAAKLFLRHFGGAREERAEGDLGPANHA